MSGYEGSQQDWLESQASDHVEREEFEREGGFVARPDRSVFDGRIVVQGDAWEIIIVEGQWTIESEWLSPNQAVSLANAILSEVEIAQRG